MCESIRPAHERATAQTVSSVDVKASLQAFPRSGTSPVGDDQSLMSSTVELCVLLLVGAATMGCRIKHVVEQCFDLGRLRRFD